MGLSKNPVIFLCMAFMLGIALGESLSLRPILYTLILLILLLIYFWHQNHRQWFPTPRLLPTALACLFCLGVACWHVHQPLLQPNHYVNVETPAAESTFVLNIESLDRETEFYEYYQAAVLQMDSQRVHGKVFLSIHKTTCESKLNSGSKLIVVGKIEPYAKPQHPFQFDYGKLLTHRGMYRKLQLEPAQIIRHSPAQNAHSREKINQRIRQKLHQSLGKPIHVQFTEALLLGQRDQLDDAVYEQFIRAGVVHILAISGLHIGILAAILQFLCKPLKRFKFGKWLSLVLIIGLLWAYAFLVGLRPSVLRAVCMFSFVSIGWIYQRQGLSLNMLCLSAFVLLLYDPNLIFEVGFQLSYAAVLAIILGFPLFNQFFRHSRFKAMRYVGSLVSVSLCAQLGVLPLTLYYFHQFPVLFLIGNLVILPVLGILISLGIIVMGWSLLAPLPDFMATSYGFCIDVILKLIQWVAQQEGFFITGIYFPRAYVWVAYVLLLLMLFTFRKKSISLLFVSLSCIICTQVGYLLHQKTLAKTSFFMIAQQYRESLLLQLNGKQLYVFTDSLSTASQKYVLQPIVNQHHVKRMEQDSLKNWYPYKNKTILVIDAAAIYELPLQQVDVILLRHSPKIALDRVIERLNPQMIVADGSNYHSFTKRWQSTCQKMKIPFHNTYEKGAFILND